MCQAPTARSMPGYIHMSIPFSAGSLYSTTEDLLRWEQGLFGGKILSAASLQKMITPFKSDYALGVAVQTENGRQKISHGGGIEGFNTFLAYYPADKLTVVVLSNINGGAPDDIARQAGRHRSRREGGAEHRAQGSHRLAQAVGRLRRRVPACSRCQYGHHAGRQPTHEPVTGQGKVPIFAESDTKFFPKVVDAEIEFFRDDKGAVSYLVLHQGGRDMKAPRTGDVVPKPERKEVTVSPKLLAEYVGTYELAPNFDLVVTLEGTQLMTQATGQEKFPVFAESDTKFFLKVVDAQVEFFRDDKGVVSYLMLHQGGQDMKAQRK